MKLKDNNNNQTTLYQARNGAVYMQFGNQSLLLNKEQVELLCSPYDLEDFDLERYQEVYPDLLKGDN